MRENSINITIVLDEYGATAGIITLEDLLEESSEKSVMNTMKTKSTLFRNGF